MSFQEQSQQQTNQQQKKAEKQKQQEYRCSNCGTSHRANDRFCGECGMSLVGSECNNCGAAVQPNWEICPQCAHSLQASLCSFCGAAMNDNDAFCPDCGNPRTGIICSDCNTLNFRSFCRKCNKPLNEMALQEVQKAQQDPVFQKMLSLAQELAELEDKLLSMPEEAPPAEMPTLSEEDKALINQYKELLNNMRSPGSAPQPPAPAPVEEAKESRSKINISFTVADVKETMDAYKQKLDEMRKTMEELIPDAGTTPQMQRNYYSARKLPVVTKTKKTVPVCWVCNLCGFKHNNPSECAEPELGGTWYYEDIVVVEKNFVYLDD